MARQLRRNSEDHQHHQHDRQHQGELHVGDAGADGLGAVGDDHHVHRRRHGAPQCRQRLLHAVHRLHDVRTRLALDVQHHRRMALVPRGDAIILGAADHAADIGQPHRRVVAPGDHQLLVCVGADQLVVGTQRHRLTRPVEAALGAVDVGRRDGAAHVLHRQPVRRHPRRIDAHPHRRAHVALHRHPADAIDLGQLRLQQRVGGVAHAVDA